LNWREPDKNKHLFTSIPLSSKYCDRFFSFVPHGVEVIENKTLSSKGDTTKNIAKILILCGTIFSSKSLLLL